MIEPEKDKEIFTKIIKKVKKIPVTVKMRKGFTDPSGDEAVRIAQIAQDCGISAVTVHGRTRQQGYSGEADWEAIGKVKQAVHIPVFGNGDIYCGSDARRFLETSGCDGVMIGRGGLGNPWIYKAIEEAFNGSEEKCEPTLEEKKDVLLKHFELEIQTEGEKIGLLKMRRIACWYLKNMPGNNEFRNTINRCESVPAMRELIRGFGQN